MYRQKWGTGVPGTGVPGTGVRDTGCLVYRLKGSAGIQGLLSKGIDCIITTVLYKYIYIYMHEPHTHLLLVPTH